MNVNVVLGGYRYSFTKERGELDDLILQFTKILNKLGIKYVVVSVYVAILFGRSRLSEDTDVIVERFEYEKFLDMWKELNKDFWCIITDNPKNAYQDYLISGYALRFSLKNKIIPNVEMKFPKSEIENLI
ncbi:hypothetical protein AciM339_0898 [Aciduliprofundum sp. MAR08-339]|uniref:hypothetical protein n=1 Tax=Aciduliprofundum sp. (strain MAR08-339) TaxID=673860 RepID=UPI0002A4A6B4|nr:hypothetical protein AciM339_0898 [Aciduliprofundum sp. MAR08-339]